MGEGLALVGELIHSIRNADAGSTAIARRAGIQHDAIAIAPMERIATANATGSLGLTPYRIGWNRLPATNASAAPRPAPIASSHAPRRRTSDKTSPRVAPIAMRMPISRVRPDPAYSMTP